MITSILPQLKIGHHLIPIMKGMSRVEIRALIARDVETFVKSPSYSIVPTDNFKKIGLHIYYNDRDRVVGYEAFDYLDQADVLIGRVSLLYTGWPLLGGQLENNKIPYTIDKDEYGITIGNDLARLYIPDIEEVEEYPVRVRAVYVPIDADTPMKSIK